MKFPVLKLSTAGLCLLVTLCPLIAGCKDDKIGGTVPTPPRDLAEKSLRAGKAPIAPPEPGK